MKCNVIPMYSCNLQTHLFINIILLHTYSYVQALENICLVIRIHSKADDLTAIV